MAKIYFKTFGCAVNFSESEVMKGLLKKAQFEIVRDVKEAYCVVFNICTVKGNATALKAIRDMKGEYPHKKIVVAGCITHDIAPQIRKIVPEASLVGTHNMKDIVSVVEETINDNPIEVLARPEKQEPKICMPRIRRNSKVAIVPIASGCKGSCAYCSVRLVKGGLFSYPEGMILEEAQKAVTQGCREIWITAQDTAAYGLDREKKSQLPQLLGRISKIPGNFKVRVGMMNPDHALPVLDDMIRAFENDKIFKFLHIPLQSGNEWILKQMGRKYTLKQFQNIVESFRASIPKITISTDVICGFPGETKIQHKESMEFINSIVMPDVLNVSRFRARPGTEAAAMENPVFGAEIKERSRHASSMYEWNAFQKNKKWIGWEGDVIIDEIGKDKTVVGRNFAYKPVILEEKLKIGDIARVRIVNATRFDLRGVLA
jgi:MiaB-like tRNA modifying enzyme